MLLVRKTGIHHQRVVVFQCVFLGEQLVRHTYSECHVIQLILCFCTASVTEPVECLQALTEDGTHVLHHFLASLCTYRQFLKLVLCQLVHQQRTVGGQLGVISIDGRCIGSLYWWQVVLEHAQRVIAQIVVNPSLRWHRGR